jgi:flavin-dependent dehydrogenase
MSVKLPAATRGRIALIGDASGAVDAITGDGLALAFRQATYLGPALAAGDLTIYEANHRRMSLLPRTMGRLLLLMAGQDVLRRRALRALAARPHTFGRLLALHVGALRPADVSLDIFGLVFRMLAPEAAVDRNA